MGDEGTLELVARVASQALVPLGEALSSPDALADLLDDLGWEVEDLVPNIGLDPAHVDDLADALEGVIDLHDGSPDDDTVVDAYARLVAAVAVLAEDIHDVRDVLADRLDAAFLTASGMADALPRRLFDHSRSAGWPSATSRSTRRQC